MSSFPHITPNRSQPTQPDTLNPDVLTKLKNFITKVTSDDTANNKLSTALTYLNRDEIVALQTYVNKDRFKLLETAYTKFLDYKEKIIDKNKGLAKDKAELPETETEKKEKKQRILVYVDLVGKYNIHDIQNSDKLSTKKPEIFKFPEKPGDLSYDLIPIALFQKLIYEQIKKAVTEAEKITVYTIIRILKLLSDPRKFIDAILSHLKIKDISYETTIPSLYLIQKNAANWIEYVHLNTKDRIWIKLPYTDAYIQQINDMIYAYISSKKKDLDVLNKPILTQLKEAKKEWDKEVAENQDRKDGIAILSKISVFNTKYSRINNGDDRLNEFLRSQKYWKDCFDNKKLIDNVIQTFSNLYDLYTAIANVVRTEIAICLTRNADLSYDTIYLERYCSGYKMLEKYLIDQFMDINDFNLFNCSTYIRGIIQVLNSIRSTYLSHVNVMMKTVDIFDVSSKPETSNKTMNYYIYNIVNIYSTFSSTGPKPYINHHQFDGVMIGVDNRRNQQYENLKKMVEMFNLLNSFHPTPLTSELETHAKQLILKKFAGFRGNKKSSKNTDSENLQSKSIAEIKHFIESDLFGRYANELSEQIELIKAKHKSVLCKSINECVVSNKPAIKSLYSNPSGTLTYLTSFCDTSSEQAIICAHELHGMMDVIRCYGAICRAQQKVIGAQADFLSEKINQTSTRDVDKFKCLHELYLLSDKFSTDADSETATHVKKQAETAHIKLKEYIKPNANANTALFQFVNSHVADEKMNTLQFAEGLQAAQKHDAEALAEQYYTIFRHTDQAKFMITNVNDYLTNVLRATLHLCLIRNHAYVQYVYTLGKPNHIVLMLMQISKNNNDFPPSFVPVVNSIVHVIDTCGRVYLANIAARKAYVSLECEKLLVAHTGISSAVECMEKLGKLHTSQTDGAKAIVSAAKKRLIQQLQNEFDQSDNGELSSLAVILNGLNETNDEHVNFHVNFDDIDLTETKDEHVNFDDIEDINNEADEISADDIFVTQTNPPDDNIVISFLKLMKQIYDITEYKKRIIKSEIECCLARNIKYQNTVVYKSLKTYVGSEHILHCITEIHGMIYAMDAFSNVGESVEIIRSFQTQLLRRKAEHAAQQIKTLVAKINTVKQSKIEREKELAAAAAAALKREKELAAAEAAAALKRKEELAAENGKYKDTIAITNDIKIKYHDVIVRKVLLCLIRASLYSFKNQESVDNIINTLNEYITSSKQDDISTAYYIFKLTNVLHMLCNIQHACEKLYRITLHNTIQSLGDNVSQSDVLKILRSLGDDPSNIVSDQKKDEILNETTRDLLTQVATNEELKQNNPSLIVALQSILNVENAQTNPLAAIAATDPDEIGLIEESDADKQYTFTTQNGHHVFVNNNNAFARSEPEPEPGTTPPMVTNPIADTSVGTSMQPASIEETSPPGDSPIQDSIAPYPTNAVFEPESEPNPPKPLTFLESAIAVMNQSIAREISETTNSVLENKRNITQKLASVIRSEIYCCFHRNVHPSAGDTLSESSSDKQVYKDLFDLYNNDDNVVIDCQREIRELIHAFDSLNSIDAVVTKIKHLKHTVYSSTIENHIMRVIKLSVNVCLARVRLSFPETFSNKQYYTDLNSIVNNGNTEILSLAPVLFEMMRTVTAICLITSSQNNIVRLLVAEVENMIMEANKSDETEVIDKLIAALLKISDIDAISPTEAQRLKEKVVAGLQETFKDYPELIHILKDLESKPIGQITDLLISLNETVQQGISFSYIDAMNCYQQYQNRIMKPNGYYEYVNNVVNVCVQLIETRVNTDNDAQTPHNHTFTRFPSIDDIRKHLSEYSNVDLQKIYASHLNILKLLTMINQSDIVQRVQSQHPSAFKGNLKTNTKAILKSIQNIVDWQDKICSLAKVAWSIYIEKLCEPPTLITPIYTNDNDISVLKLLDLDDIVIVDYLRGTSLDMIAKIVTEAHAIARTLTIGNV